MQCLTLDARKQESIHSGASFATPAFSTPAILCRVFHSRVFSRPVQTTRPRQISMCKRTVKNKIIPTHPTKVISQNIFGPTFEWIMLNDVGHIW